MKADKFIIISEKEIESVLTRIITQIFDKKIIEISQRPEDYIERTYSINQVAKMLKRSHKKISTLVQNGVFKVSLDNKIYESSLMEYINFQKGDQY